MRTGQSETAERCGVGAQFVGTSNFGAKPCFLSSLRISRSAARLSRGAGQEVEDLALVIDGPPRGTPLPGDPHHHLVQVPLVARPRRRWRSRRAIAGTEFQHPTSHRFVGRCRCPRSASSSSTSR